MPTLKNGLRLQRDPKVIAIADDVDTERGLDQSLKRRGLRPVRFGNSKDPEKLVERLREMEADGAVTRTSSTFDRQVLEGTDLSVVQGACKGPHVDVQAAQALGVEVLKVDTNRMQVIDLVEACLRSAASGLIIGNNFGRKGEWSKGETSRTILPIEGMRIGVIGYGDIGQGVAERLAPHVEGVGAFNHQFELVRPYDRRIQDHAERNGVRWFASVEELLEWANVITLHVDEVDAMGNKNGRLVDTEQLRSWGTRNTAHGNPTGILLNIARGPLAPSLQELDALLKGGALHSAFVDAHPKEIEVKGKFTLPQDAHPGLVTTPHIGGSGRKIEVQTGKDVNRVLGTWIDEGSFTGSRVYQHEIMDASALCAEGVMLLRIARSTHRGSSEAVQRAIISAGLENLGGDLSITDRVAGSKSRTWNFVPHIIAMSGFNGNYADKALALAKELDAANNTAAGKLIAAARFIPTTSDQRAALREAIR